MPLFVMSLLMPYEKMGLNVFEVPLPSPVHLPPPPPPPPLTPRLLHLPFPSLPSPFPKSLPFLFLPLASLPFSLVLPFSLPLFLYPPPSTFRLLQFSATIDC